MKILYISIFAEKLVIIDEKHVFVFIIHSRIYNNGKDLIEATKNIFKEHIYKDKVEFELKNLGYVIEFYGMYNIKLIVEHVDMLFKSKSDVIKILFSNNFMKKSDMWDFSGWCCDEAKKIIDIKDENSSFNTVIASYIKKVYSGFYNNHENIRKSNELVDIRTYFKRECEFLRYLENDGLTSLFDDTYDRRESLNVLLHGCYQESHVYLISLHYFKEKNLREKIYSDILQKLLTYF